MRLRGRSCLELEFADGALLSSGRPTWRAAKQRKEPVAAGGRTHGDRHQADIRLGQQPCLERQLYEAQLTPDCESVFVPLGRLLPPAASGSYRTISDIHCPYLVALKLPIGLAHTHQKEASQRRASWLLGAQSGRQFGGIR